MESERFDPERRSELHSSLANLSRVLWEVEPPAEADGHGRSVDTDEAATADGLRPLARPIARILKAAGYPADVSRLVLSLLERCTDPDRADNGLPVRDLQLLVEPSNGETDARAAVKHVLKVAGYPTAVSRLVVSLLESTDGLLDPREPVRAILRAAGYRVSLANLVVALLERYQDPEQAAGLQISDLRPLVESSEDAVAVREPVRRILRVAGYRVDLIDLVGALLDRFGAAEPPTSGLRIRELGELMKEDDEGLVGLLRHWRTPAPDSHVLGSELATVLGRRGVDAEVARDLGAAIANDPGSGQLAEVARVARFALSAEDACISVAEPGWMDDPRFASAYAEAKAISAWGRDIRWRIQTLVKLAAAARHLEGDFVECGVDTGGTARAVMAYLGDDAFAGRSFYLFDTFNGIVEEQLLPDEHVPIEDRFPDVAAIARANFSDKPYARIVEGAVPESLASYTGSQVAYLHIDMNAAYPEVKAFEHFWPLLAPGAPVVFDDYGFPRHRVQRRALDEVAAELGVEIMMLPTCQGVVMKPAKGA